MANLLYGVAALTDQGEDFLLPEEIGPLLVSPPMLQDALDARGVAGTFAGQNADWSIPANAVHVVVPSLTASRTWSLPDVDGYPYAQDLVIVDEARILDGSYTLAIGVLYGSGDTIPGWTNDQIKLADPGASVRLRRGILSNVWVVV